MSIAAASLLALAAAHAGPVGAPSEPVRSGVQVETAQVSVTILRAAVMKGGEMMPRAADLPRARRHVEAGRIAYTFE